MPSRPRIAVATVVGLLGFVAPIALSIQFAWNQSVAGAEAVGTRYAAEVVRRSEVAARQFGRAIKVLNHDNLPPCSPQEIELMRSLDLGSDYLQMVGRVSGNTLECSSLGTTTRIDIGPPTLTTEHGAQERLDFKYGPTGFGKVSLLTANGVAAAVDGNLLLDFDTGSDGARLALVVPSSHDHTRIIQSSGAFDPSWFNPIGRGESKSYLDGENIISHVRSRQLDIEAVSVIPSRLVYRRVRQFAVVFVPIGCLCGLGFAWAVMYISRSRGSLTGLLRAAARNNSFFVEYQPVVEIATRRVVGAEALVRWRRGDTVISPASFIGLAEESGVITEITRIVIENVARDLPRLLEISPDFRVAINFTATDLKHEATAKRLMELVQRSGGSARNIVVEATEHGLVSGVECSRMISVLRLEGFRVAIDDFGTGYSSLSCLQGIDLDLLKIDKAFVDTIGTDGVTRGVVLHIIEIARSLQLTMVAEGIETEQQARFLLERGVEYGQGWLFGKPMSIENLTKMARETESAQPLVPA
ncbi:EAL domain-containing protein [Acidobacteria bacterium AB60]|nr:EAL domain-containing protein [Acidobacteria bacterium AB60]